MTTFEKANETTSFLDLAAFLKKDSVKIVKLTNLEITGDEDDEFMFSKAIRGHPSLEEIHLTKVKCADERINMDAMIEMAMVSCQNLRVLEINQCPVKAKAVGTLGYCSSLKILNLPNNGFNDADAQLIADVIAANSSVETVDLSGNKISDIGCKSIGICLEKNTSVQKINLSGNSISSSEGTKIEAKWNNRVAIAA